MSPQKDTDGGLLYVASRITSLQCPRDVYNHWYDKVLVPDTLKTPGINSAIRYDAAQPQREAVVFPFLAVYPVADVSSFQTEEFRGIPLHSVLLPGPSYSCLDVAQFDNRRYRAVGKWDSGVSPIVPTRNMLSVEFEPPAELCGASGKRVLDWYVGSNGGHNASTIRLYKVFWALLYRGEKSKNLLPYLALHEFEREVDCRQAASSISLAAKKTSWSARRTFGNTEDELLKVMVSSGHHAHL